MHVVLVYFVASNAITKSYKEMFFNHSSCRIIIASNALGILELSAMHLSLNRHGALIINKRLPPGGFLVVSAAAADVVVEVDVVVV